MGERERDIEKEREVEKNDISQIWTVKRRIRKREFAQSIKRNK